MASASWSDGRIEPRVMLASGYMAICRICARFQSGSPWHLRAPGGRANLNKTGTSIMNPLVYSHVGAAVALLVAPAAHAVVEQAVGGITTGVAISQISSALDDTIKSARDAGDYLTMRAAMEAKGAIEAWKEANKELLDKAFSSLNESQQRMFNNARQLTEQINDDVANRLETGQQLVNQANQIVESIPLATKNTYVTRYSPRVRPAQVASTVRVRVNGVNLDKGDPQVILEQGSVSRSIIGPLEVQFTVPASALPSQPDKLSVVPLKLSYSTPKDGYLNRLFGRRETVERELPVVTLPTNIGRYSLSVVTKEERKEVQSFTSQQQKFRGRNTNDQKVAKPPEGWRWDWSQGVGAFKQVGGGGEAGSCNGVMANESSPDGITHSAHLDEIKQVSFPRIVWGPGWQNCAVVGPIYRMTTMAVTQPYQTGTLSWTEDQRFALPANTLAIELAVTTFDGRKRVFSGSGFDKFFLVDRGTSELILKPKQPDDI